MTQGLGRSAGAQALAFSGPPDVVPPLEEQEGDPGPNRATLTPCP